LKDDKLKDDKLKDCNIDNREKGIRMLELEERAVLDLLCVELLKLNMSVYAMLELYNRYTWLNDEIDISSIIPMSLEEWHLEINTVVSNLSSMRR